MNLGVHRLCMTPCYRQTKEKQSGLQKGAAAPEERPSPY